MEVDFCALYGPPPTFIRSILQNDDPVRIIYKKAKKLSDSDETAYPDSTLDLTGNPLIVDLKYDANLTILPKRNNWTEAELSYLPLSLHDARTVLNKYINKEYKCDDGSGIYCICSPSDKKQTVILGSYVYTKCEIKQFIRTVITLAGCFAENDAKLSLEHLKNEHDEAVGQKNSKINCVVTNKYALYGTNLKHNDVEYNSSIHMDVSWNNFQYVLPKYVKSMEMTLQCIVGHKYSKLHNLWKELHLLNNYIMILDKGFENVEKISISNDPEAYTKVIVKLCEVLKINTIQRPTPEFNTSQTELNMEDLREYNLLDKLWTILTRCQRVEDLKVCFHTFFEELAQSRVNINIPDHNQSVISRLVDKISAGEIAVPTLTPKRAVECLIELGIEKLKNDYLYILNHFDTLSSEKLHGYWNKISEENEDKSIDFRMHVRLSHLSLFDVSEIQAKFNFLTQMHTALEFVLLAKYFTAVTHETFTYVIDCILKQYLSFDDIVQLRLTLPTCQFHEFKIPLNSMDTNFLQGLKPISRNFKLSTDNKSSNVTTIFHQTREPLFPPTIYNSYDIPANTDEDLIFFVAKSVTYSSEV